MESTMYYVKSAPDRKRALESLVEDARRADIRDDDVFHEIIGLASVILEMSNKQIGYALGVARPTVNRWINRQSSPQALMRKSIYSWIAAEAKNRLRARRDAENVGGFSQVDSNYAMVA